MRQSFIFCEQCDRTIHHPLWIRYDHDEHIAHCRSCAAERDRTFIPELAIKQAISICRFEQAVLAGRCVRDGGVE